MPSFSSAASAGRISPRTSILPLPISAAIRCASGARSPDAPTLPCDGMTGMASCSSKRLERLDHQRPNAGMAAAEAEQLEHDHQPRDVARQRLAEARAVRQDQVGLQLGEPVVGNARVGEQAEAGVDAVDRLAAGDDALDRGGGVGDALHRASSRRAARARPDAGAASRDRLPGRIELHAPTIGRSSPCSCAQSIAMSIARVGVAHDAGAGVVPQHALQPPRGIVGAVGDDHHAGMLRIAHADAAAVVERDPGRAAGGVEQAR